MAGSRKSRELEKSGRNRGGLAGFSPRNWQRAVQIAMPKCEGFITRRFLGIAGHAWKTLA